MAKNSTETSMDTRKTGSSSEASPNHVRRPTRAPSGAVAFSGAVDLQLVMGHRSGGIFGRVRRTQQAGYTVRKLA
ncbi:Uncharacterised protein [Mycobacteroides abscessus subsp. abscessus]|nr:Uncharacterised protein [Mycobacteroides abscessus subsp. abscessus]